MTLLTIELPDDRLAKLQQRAIECGMTIEDLVQLSINDILTRPTNEFREITQYVLKKNTELYRRLAI